MKKEKSDLPVYLVMILLLMLIIVPPFFRMLMPKQNTPSNDTIIDDIVLLNCNKTDNDGLLTALTTIKYRNGVLENNTIKFTKNEVPVDNNMETIPTEQQENITMTVSSEYNTFMSFTYLNPVVDGNTTIIPLTPDLIGQDETNYLNSYLQNQDEQKAYYENMGYTCNVLRS